MHVPALLQSLIESGVWQTPDSAHDERISAETARRWDPIASGIHLMEHPVLSYDLEVVPELAELWNLDDVDPARCLVIADFGPGSDNPIVLDFTQEPPSVRTMNWPRGPQTRTIWITIAPTFDEFARELGFA